MTDCLRVQYIAPEKSKWVQNLVYDKDPAKRFRCFSKHEYFITYTLSIYLTFRLYSWVLLHKKTQKCKSVLILFKLKFPRMLVLHNHPRGTSKVKFQYI